MSSIEPVVRAQVLSQFCRVIASQAIDPDLLLAAVGLDRDDIARSDNYISLNTVAELFELAARRTSDNCFGLRYATSFPEGGSGLLGQLMMSAPTVGDVLKLIGEYVELLIMPMRARLVEQGSIYSLFVGYPPTFRAPHMQYTDFLLAALVLRLRHGAGLSWTPYAVELAHRIPEDPAPYHRIFGERLSFNAAHYRIDVNAADMVKPMPKLMEGLSRTVQAQAIHVLEEVRMRYDITQRTFMAVTERLENRRVHDLDVVAGELKMSPRALQWRLEQAGTSYERQLARARRRIAVQLLRDTDLAISQIALSLGYSETSAFTRAAFGWYAETPKALRKRLREAEPDDKPGVEHDQ